MSRQRIVAFKWFTPHAPRLPAVSETDIAARFIVKQA